MSLPLERWTFALDAKGRVKQIDAQLKEKLAPGMDGRSERIRWLYELGFAIVCGDRTNEMVRAVLLAWQANTGVNYSQRLPAAIPAKAGGGEGGPAQSSEVVGPLRLSVVSHPFRAALVQEEMEARDTFLSARNARGWHGSTSLRSSFSKYVHTGRTA